jgi:hypothetical protein
VALQTAPCPSVGARARRRDDALPPGVRGSAS